MFNSGGSVSFRWERERGSGQPYNLSHSLPNLQSRRIPNLDSSCSQGHPLLFPKIALQSSSARVTLCLPLSVETVTTARLPQMCEGWSRSAGQWRVNTLIRQTPPETASLPVWASGGTAAVSTPEHRKISLYSSDKSTRARHGTPFHCEGLSTTHETTREN